ncbi:MAG TPA: NlpC/P60 family protein [Chthoniobacterales bacterium]|nr:NlpC/P60 family protein [Chthoniobacterales bacterium]
MRRRITAAIAVAAIAGGAGFAVHAPAAESFGTKMKKIFAATPTPTPRKHTKKKSTAEKSPTPKPTATPEKSPSPKKKSSPSPTPAETPTASVSSKKKKSSPTPSPESSPSASSKKKKKPKSSPTPSASPNESPSASASPSVTPEASETPKASASPKKKGAPASISSAQISGYDNYPENIRKMIDTALELTTRNLDYTYGSADPSSGGMDCSGFVFYVLNQAGLHEVPRDSSQQYVWLRKAGTFRSVNSRHDDTFELEELKPGDLLFWTGTYSIERDPPITHAMIYLGREKGTNQRVMVGASDGRTYKGESRYGVSVFDFKVARTSKTEEGRLTPTFIGYGHIPGL